MPGIGPATAEKILQARKSYGAFKSVDDLQAIKGIGPKKLDKVRKYLTVDKSSQNKAPAKQPATAAKDPPPKKPTPSRLPPPMAKNSDQATTNLSNRYNCHPERSQGSAFSFRRAAWPSPPPSTDDEEQ